MKQVKKLPDDIRNRLEGQIECEGFDYAMTEKLSPDDVLDEELKTIWQTYLDSRNALISALSERGVEQF
jgi:hypothetical protein